MKKSYKYILLAGLLILGVVVTFALVKKVTTQESRSDKVYVAAEDGGEIDVIDAKNNVVTKKIDLTIKQGDKSVMYMAHNVQVAPNGKSVWVTANAMSGKHTSVRSKLKNYFVPTAYADNEHNDEAEDQLIVIDPLTDTVTKRIAMGPDLHLAHVALTPDNKYAIAVAQEKGAIYKIDTANFQIVQTVSTKQGDEPHGLRISPDGKSAYIAMMGGKSIGQFNLETGDLSYVSLNGKPVQTGITSDGKYVLATVFDSKSVAVYDVFQKRLSYVSLPTEAKGPLQLYPTPDAKFAFVADQGNYFNQPDGDSLYKVDLEQLKVINTIKVGTAPHGVVVSPNGKFVYITNLVSNDVSVVDITTNKEVARISTGAMPNGISYWTNNQK
jgi:YVTN family beta-propeller protein